MRNFRLVVLTLLVAGVTAQASRPTAQSSSTTLTPDAYWQRATDGWDAGNYPAALEDLRALMRSTAAPEYFERVALLTGELFTTTELSTDGRNPRISGSGTVATFETGPAQTPVTRVVRLDPAPQTLAEIQAVNVVLDPAGTRAAWLRTNAAAPTTDIVVRDLAAGTERSFAAGSSKTGLAWSSDGGALWYIGQEADASRSDVYRVAVSGESAAPVRITEEPGFKTNLMLAPDASVVVYTSSAASPFAGRGAGGAAGRGGGAGRGGAGGGTSYVVFDPATKRTRTVTGTALTISADGSTLAWLVRDGDLTTLNVSPAKGDQVTAVRAGRERIDAPALAPDGRRVAYQLMTNTDWEIYLTDVASAAHTRVTRDIQHDLLPRFLSNERLLGMMGEARHRRSQLYDLATGTRTRLFANNTVRTISPEYIWLPSADGRRLIVSAERDGDTVSTERGVYIVDLSRKVTAADVAARIDRQLADETDLRTRMAAAFKPVDDTIRRTVARAAQNRVHEFEKTLFDFDSKYVSQPGNRKAIEYLQKTYRSFGYAPELQEFSPPQAQGKSTANVVSIKRGTENPELIYVVSSHFDSVAVGPGADDDTSGTAALLEAARLLADVPLPATVVFASFTGEEAGLLGSREFVRRAAESKWNIVGALNNDMIGWGAESSRMDNTIRYSNAGIRDIQHGAAFLFTNLITYDAKYYKSTDAAAFYDGWGDIVGGIGSYPVLANPNYHQPTDFLETMNFRQIMETAKVTAATLIYLSSSPSRLKDLKASRSANGIDLTWAASPEKGIRHYVVAYGPASDPLRTRRTVTSASATLPSLSAGTVVAVKAVNQRGLEGWDWVRTVIQ